MPKIRQQLPTRKGYYLFTVLAVAQTIAQTKMMFTKFQAIKKP